MGDYAGSWHGEGKSMPETGLQSLGQGSWIRARNGEGWAGSRCRVPKMETKVCGKAGYTVEDFRMSLGHGNTWIRVPVLHGVTQIDLYGDSCATMIVCRMNIDPRGIIVFWNR